MLHELYVRGRESTRVGFLPILLLVWLHHEHALHPLLLWAGLLIAVQAYRLLTMNEMDTVFFLHLIFLIGLSSFMLSSIGIDARLYGGFLLVIVGGTLAVLSVQHPEFLRQYPVVPVGFVVYAFMLLVRSRGEYRRTREWISARLNRQLLLAQLNATLDEERVIKEQLRQQSQELENRTRELSELAVRDGLTRAFRRGHIASPAARD